MNDAKKTKEQLIAELEATRQRLSIFEADELEGRRIHLERQELFDLNPDLVCVASIDGRFFRINSSWEEALGYTKQEILSNTFLYFVHPDDRKDTIKEFTRGIDRNTKIQMVNRWRSKNGEYKWLEWRATRAKEQSLIIASARDISERKQIEQSLLQARDEACAANKAKSEFLANMSHEIRTPLNGILGMLQLLGMTTLDKEQKEYILAAIKSSKRLTQLLSDILDLSRIESGNMSLQECKFHVQELKDLVFDLFEAAAKTKGLDMDCFIDESVPRFLFGDAGRITQILFNLVGNAIKFTVKGVIRIDIVALPNPVNSKSRVLFMVKDTGIGISDDLLKIIFEPFFQAEVTYSKRFQGAGLGLAIVRKLVLFMGGELAIESNEGEGTTVYLSLPLSLPAEANATEGKPANEGEPVKGSFKILVAEDDELSMQSALLMLQKFGHEALPAKDGKEALQRLTEQDFDLILMDSKCLSWTAWRPRRPSEEATWARASPTSRSSP